MFDTLLLRPSLHCNTLLHFTTLHPTTLRYTSPNYTSLHLLTLHLHSFTLHYPFISFLHLHFLSFYFTSHLSHHITSTDLIPKIISKKVNPVTALKNISPLYFTSLFILFYLFVYLSYQPYTSLYFAIPNYSLLPFTSLLFTFYFLSPLLPLTGLHFPNPRFENKRFTL